MEKNKELIPANSRISESNVLINSIYTLTVQEQRLLLILISMVNPKDDKEFRICRLPVKVFQQYVGIKGQGYYTKLDKLTDTLMGRFLRIPKKDGGWDKFNWLEKCTYHKKDAIVELEISKSLAPYLLDLKSQYTSYELLNVIHLKSNYSIRVYRLLKQFEKIKERYFTIEELKHTLDIPPNQYKLYGHLKKKIILKAQEDLLNKKNNCDIYFKFREKHGPRNKVIGIIFFIFSNNYEGMVEVENKFLPENELIDSIKNINIYLRLLEYGVDEKVSKKLIKEYNEEQILENFEYVDYKIKTANKKIGSIPGYVVSSIKENWKLQTNMFDHVKKKISSKNENLAKKKRDIEFFESDMDFSYEKVKKKHIETYKKNLSEKELNDIEEKCMSLVIQEHGKSHKLRNTILVAQVNTYIANHIKFPDIEEWKEIERKKRPDLYNN